MKRVVFYILLFSLVLSVGARYGFAAEVDSESDSGSEALTVDDSTGAGSESETAPESSVQVVLPDEPLPVVIQEDVSAYAVSGSGYSGMISSQYVDYFSGLAAKYPFKDYLFFRSDQYSYTLFYDADLIVSGTRVTGTASALVYTSRSGSTTLTYSGSQSVNLQLSNVSAYSNKGDFPSLPGVYNDVTQKVLAVSACACLLLYCFHLVFYRGSARVSG